MLITCLRHATAEPHSLTADADRALIKKGLDQVARVAEFCLKNRLQPGRLYCSPLLRAEQTAQHLADALSECPRPLPVEWLALGAEPVEIVEELMVLQAARVGDVWLVGHEPDLSALIAHLLGAEHGCISVKKASLTRLEVDLNADSAAAKLLWSVPCALMR